MMKNIVRAIPENYLSLWWLTLLNHFLLMIYIYHKIPVHSSIDFGRNLILIMVFILVLFSYLCHFVNFKHSELKLWLIILMFLVSWQAIINQDVSNTLFHFLDILNPLNSFLLVYSSISIILLGELVGEELFSVSFGLTVITVITYFINSPLFVFLSLFTSFFLTFLPLILLTLYRKELRNLLKYQRRNLVILALILPFSYIISYVNTAGSEALNLVWYIEVISILASVHFKTIINSFRKKIYELKLSYLKAFSRLFLVIGGLLICSFIIFRLDLNTSFFVLNLMLLISGLCTEELIRLFNSSDMIGAKDYLEILLFKRNKMVRNLLSNEDIEQQFSEFLHNEVLQNIMAIKNFNIYSENKNFGGQINLVTEELVQRIRERMDYYQPMGDNNVSLDKKYQSLIDRIRRRYDTKSLIVVNFPENFYLMSPYDNIIYRFVEELITNAVKYSDGDEISLLIEVKADCILLVSENKCIPKERSFGYGLKNISNKLSVLGGRVDILEKDSIFRVTITLPVDKELCYESFVN